MKYKPWKISENYSSEQMIFKFDNGYGAIITRFVDNSFEPQRVIIIGDTIFRDKKEKYHPRIDSINELNQYLYKIKRM